MELAASQACATAGLMSRAGLKGEARNILGRGGSGKSTLPAKLGEIKGLPLIRGDKILWQPGLEAMPHAEWVKTQRRLVERERWIQQIRDTGGASFDSES